MIDWKKYVDHIYILTNTHKDTNNLNIFFNELNNVNIDINDISFVTVFTNINSPIYDTIYYNYFIGGASNAAEQYISGDKVLYCLLGHYYLCKLAESKKYERIMILEDDASFLKDHTLIEQILNKLYADDFDIAIELVNNETYNNIKNNIINIHHADHQNEMIAGSLANIYSKRGYEEIIYLIEEEKINFAIDEYYLYYENLKIVYSSIPFCVCNECEIIYSYVKEYYNSLLSLTDKNILDYYKLLSSNFYFMGRSKNDLYNAFCNYLEFHTKKDQFINEYNAIKEKII